MSSRLASYLKARRAQVTPADVGLEPGSGRRVPGLRREEVALVAGVSVDYYARLEQGRERNPSPSVLNALANARGLDEHQRAHRFRATGLLPPGRTHRGPAPSPQRCPSPSALNALANPLGRDQPQRESLFRVTGLLPTARTKSGPPPSLQGLLDMWPHTPAMVLSRRLDVLSHNALAAALYSDFAQVDNVARMTFLDPAARRFFRTWDTATEAVVAQLRLSLSFVDASEDVCRLVVELSEASTRFRELWARHDVRGKTHATKTLHHTSVGELAFDVHAFDVKAGPPGHQLVVYHAAPTSPTGEKLQLLASLQATASNPS